jgi:ParB family chromosome partitioning protein
MTAAKKTTDEKVQQIPVEQLYLSPGETRKTLDQAALKELAASIALNGVLEALLVRPLPVDGWKSLPDEIVSAHSSDTLYEIVAGQRRHAASKIAGKATCPCIVREMSDAEAAELRIISNLQREDLSPLEEALAFKALLAVPGATIETVAAKLAKLASYVAPVEAAGCDRAGARRVEGWGYRSRPRAGTGQAGGITTASFAFADGCWL